MRVAIFHDYFDNVGGGEKLVVEAARSLDATIITTNVSQSVVKTLELDGVRIIDMGSTHKTIFLRDSFAALKFLLCDFTKNFDYFIFSGNRSIFAAWRHKPNFWYCHSPERAAFDMHEFYRNQLPFLKRIGFVLSALLFRAAFFLLTLPHIQRIVTNSENVKRRIKRLIGKDSVVVHPPIRTKNFFWKKPNGYWLSVNRLYPDKCIELQLEAFRLLPGKRLIVVGTQSEADSMRSYAETLFGSCPQNVEFLGRVTERRLSELYASCEGFIATSMDEDFGMSVVEAMASGKPVVAVDAGGFRETVAHGKTGFLVKDTPEEIAYAVRKASRNPVRFKKACIARAKEFDEKKFGSAMRGLIG